MKAIALKLAVLALLPAATLTFTSCSTVSGERTIAVVEAEDGTVIIDTFKTSATVTAIDATKRKITLTFPDGKRKTVKAGPEVRNFDQIHINDRVDASVTQELAVFLGTDGAPPSAAGAAGVALAPLGAKPGALVADTVQLTAVVSAINTKNRKVKLSLPDGTSKTVKARKNIDLSKVNVGDNVIVQHTEAIAIVVTKQ